MYWYCSNRVTRKTVLMYVQAYCAPDVLMTLFEIYVGVFKSDVCVVISLRYTPFIKSPPVVILAPFGSFL
jgi:hypothetical protein